MTWLHWALIGGCLAFFATILLLIMRGAAICNARYDVGMHQDFDGGFSAQNDDQVQ
jgi:hypothetical protein